MVALYAAINVVPMHICRTHHSSCIVFLMDPVQCTHAMQMHACRMIYRWNGGKDGVLVLCRRACVSGELKECLVDWGKSARGLCQSWSKNGSTSNGNGRGFEEVGRVISSE